MTKDITKLINRLIIEQKKNDKCGIYAYTQKFFAYNSNRIEGSKLTMGQTISLFETGMLKPDEEYIRFKDAEEMTGHFVMFNYMLQTYLEPLSEELIKTYHKCLKSGVFEDMANGYPVGEYKNRSNIVGNIKTSKPEDVEKDMQELLGYYNSKETITLYDIAEFHVRYEKIHPFQDGNGRTGRMIMYKECLKNNIFPFIIEDDRKQEYYDCLSKEDNYESLVAFFKSEQETYYKEATPLINEINE